MLGSFPPSGQAGCEMPAGAGGYQDEGLPSKEGLVKPLPSLLPDQLRTDTQRRFVYPAAVRARGSCFPINHDLVACVRQLSWSRHHVCTGIAREKQNGVVGLVTVSVRLLALVGALAW